VSGGGKDLVCWLKAKVVAGIQLLDPGVPPKNR
jgi:hypothetical protein